MIDLEEGVPDRKRQHPCWHLQSRQGWRRSQYRRSTHQFKVNPFLEVPDFEEGFDSTSEFTR